ncbi:MAG TPA: DUF6687 family protein [Ilumatobacter sp.]|nr:DUF6687 family protein [Ilumatobacter sp.]
MKFVPYEQTRELPNIVVDGSPNAATVLTLTHWPGISQPPQLAHDLSAGMAFRYLDDPPAHTPATAVTNNHFDQDGLVAAFALTRPTAALRHRQLLIDLAAAGDFGTYRDRRAARASMTVSRMAEAGFDDYAEFAARCYAEALPQVLDMLLEGDRFRDLWGDEDAELDRSEHALASGAIRLVEHPELDLAVATAADGWRRSRGHRFGGDEYEGVHPMALNNATACARVLFVHGRRYRYTDRYETWVQYVSRRPPARRDLRPLAEQLTAAEAGTVVWSASPPGALSPTLDHDGESSLDATTVFETLTRHLRTAPPAWDPYAIEGP